MTGSLGLGEGKGARRTVEAARPGLRVLGVDPGLTRTGWALVAAEAGRYRLLSAGVLSPGPLGDLGARLAAGFRGFTGVLDECRPDLVAMEDVFVSPRFPAAALKLAHLRGCLCLAAALAGLDVITLTATTVKQRLTGSGHASKDQIRRMVFELCDVTAVKVPNDLTDAVALAIAGLHQLQLARVQAPAGMPGPLHGRSRPRPGAAAAPSLAGRAR